MSTETLLVELGTEELPPKSLKQLALSFRDSIVQSLEQRELSHGEVQWLCKFCYFVCWVCCFGIMYLSVSPPPLTIQITQEKLD